MGKNIVGKIYHRPWGTYKTLKLGVGYQVKIITINSNGKLSLQKHFKRAEHWVIVKGEPTITIGEQIKKYKENDHIYIPLETAHRIENLTNESIEIIEVQIGSYLGEDDIERLSDIYGRGHV